MGEGGGTTGMTGAGVAFLKTCLIRPLRAMEKWRGVGVFDRAALATWVSVDMVKYGSTVLGTGTSADGDSDRAAGKSSKGVAASGIGVGAVVDRTGTGSCLYVVEAFDFVDRRRARSKWLPCDVLDLRLGRRVGVA